MDTQGLRIFFKHIEKDLQTFLIMMPVFVFVLILAILLSTHAKFRNNDKIATVYESDVLGEEVVIDKR